MGWLTSRVARNAASAKRGGWNSGKLAALVNLANVARDRARSAETRLAADEQARADGEGGSWFRIENAAGQSGPAEVYLYDMIGGWGITADEFAAELRAIKAGQIDLRINCEGGEVFDGVTIFEAIARHPAQVTAHVDGVAASAASFIVQAADERVMGRYSRAMIHDAHAICLGNARDMRDTANLLDSLSSTIADIYADRSGRGDQASWREAMLAGMDGTWYDAQQAVAAGLADRVADNSTKPNDRAPVVPRNQQTPSAEPPPADSAPAPEQEPANDLAWDPAAFLRITTEWPALIVDPEPDPGPPAINPYELIRTVREATGR
jgi:ATP-dependent protease ClpP protease subunit